MGTVWLGAGLLATLCAAPVAAVGVAGQGTWESTLLGRDINGQAVAAGSISAVFLYDTALNVTWLRDGNYAGTSGTAPVYGSPSAYGVMDWATATSWASTLTVGAFTGWRLPTMVDTGAAGCDFSYAGGTDCGYNVQTASSEIAHLHYVTLGNLSRCPPGDSTCVTGPQPGWGLTNTATFKNLKGVGYWSGLEYAPDLRFVWLFSPETGIQGSGWRIGSEYALAVRAGDVAAVPEPQTLALILAGLTGLAGLSARRRKH